jgi:hypothetical protein
VTRERAGSLGVTVVDVAGLADPVARTNSVDRVVTDAE